ncbi:hypothetical protein NL676_033131 [Syzygium grande]|nr:hypothetical protein NL676_033131 [Syzygium grande]
MHPYLVSNHGDERRTFSGDGGPSGHLKSELNTRNHSAENWEKSSNKRWPPPLLLCGVADLGVWTTAPRWRENDGEREGDGVGTGTLDLPSREDDIRADAKITFKHASGSGASWAGITENDLQVGRTIWVRDRIVQATSSSARGSTALDPLELLLSISILSSRGVFSRRNSSRERTGSHARPIGTGIDNLNILEMRQAPADPPLCDGQRSRTS